MTTTSTSNTPATDTPATECGPDCIYINGACRCHEGEAAGAEPDWIAGIDPPF